MTAPQEAKLNMYRATQKHCEASAALIATIPAFAIAFGSYKAKVASIIATAQQEEVITKGIAIDKDEAKKTLCQLATDIAAPIFAYASANNNNTLKQSANTSYSELLRSKDDQLAPRCQNIFDSAKNNLTALAPYGITTTTIATLQSTIDNYQAKVPTPRNAAAQKSTIKKNLVSLFKETDKVLKEQLDKTLVAFKAVNPDFVKTYKSNRIIIDPAKTTTTLKGKITNSKDGTVVANATIIIAPTGATGTTTKLGFYTIKPIAQGTYTAKITATNYTPKEQTEIVVKQGQINKQDITLDPM